MTPVKAGAIALILIIACPIILGYALASDSEDVDRDVTSSGGSLSDYVLNSETAYYMQNSSPTNNSMLRYSVSAQGSLETTIKAPDYVSLTSTYTSIPEYGVIGTTYTLDTPVTTTHSFPTSTGRAYGVGYGTGTSTIDDLGAHALYKIVTTNADSEITSTMSQLNFGSRTFMVTSANDIYIYQVDSSTWSYTYGSTTYTASTWEIISDQNPVYTVTTRDFVDITPSYPTYVITMGNQTGIARLGTYSGYTYVKFTSLTSITNNNGVVTIGSTTYTGVTSLAVVLTSTTTSLYYTMSGIKTGSYAQPEYGWTIPTNSNPYYAEWMNGQINNYIRMYLYIPSGEACALTPIKTDGTNGVYTEIASTGGVITVNGSTLGTYTYVLAEIESDGITVTGLSGGWPSLGASPVRYASITVDDDNTLDISRVYLQSNFNGSEVVRYRVDVSTVMGGTFPSTKDFTLDLWSLYPNDDRQGIYVNSVGVYGDYLTIGDRTFTVSGGQIYCDGVSYGTVRGLTVSIDEDDGSYAISVNGESYTSASGTIILGGEWSLTLQRMVTTTETATMTSWVPGEFALDKDGFVLAMLMTAVGVFLVLGMSGARSGGKIGILLLICGGAAVIGLMII